MHERAHRVALIPATALALLLLSACAASSASAPASQAVTPSPEPSLAGPSIPTACMGLGLAECAAVLDIALAAGASAAPAVYAQVGPFGCPVEPGCPSTLAARPEGDVTLDLANGTQTTVHIKAAADGSMTPTPGEAFGFPVEPMSGPAGPAPVAFSLGHCGLSSGFDVDGSYWDPVGLIDPDDVEAINSGDGTITFTGPDHALYTSKGGWNVQLIRHQGPKFLPGCM
jgi:hypothetical protein